MKEQLLKLTKGSLIYGIGNAINSFLQLLLLPLFTTYLIPKEYGILSTLTIFSVLISSVFSFGFGTSIGLVYFDKKDSNHRAKTIWTSAIILLIISLLVFFLGFLFTHQIDSLLFKEKQNNNFILLSLLSACLIIIEIPFIFRLQFEEKQIKFVTINLIFILLNLGLKILFVIVLKMNVLGMLWSEVISRSITLFIYLISIQSFTPILIQFSIIKDLFKFGLPMLPSFLSIYLIQQGNIYLLQYFYNLSLVGIYSTGYMLGYSIVIITSAISTAWFPYFMSFIDNKDEAKFVFGKMTTYYVRVLGSISLLYYVIAKPLVIVFMAQSYYKAYEVIGYTATAYFFSTIFNLLLPPSYYRKNILIPAICQMAGAVMFLISAFFLIPKFGLFGSAISLIIGYSLISILLFIANKRMNFKIIYENRMFVLLVFYIATLILLSIDYSNLMIGDFFIKLLIFSSFILINYMVTTKAEKSSIANYINYSFRKNSSYS
jgi:O-antigen/teichoic acid export membrane protein